MRATASFIGIVALTVLGPGAVVGASETPAVALGEPVQVSYRVGAELAIEEGRLIGLDRLAVTVDDGTLSKQIARDRVAQMAVLRGTKPMGRRGALVGGAIGLGAGAALSIALPVFVGTIACAQGSDRKEPCEDPSLKTFLISASVLTVTATTIGAVIGRNHQRNNWVEAEWKDVVVGVGPAPGGRVLLTASRRF